MRLFLSTLLFCFSFISISAQLPQSVSLSGAGEIGANQSYTLALFPGQSCLSDPLNQGMGGSYMGDSDFNYTIMFDDFNLEWIIMYNDPFAPYTAYKNSSSDDCNFPTSGWQVVNGIAPAPSVGGVVNPCANSTLTVTATIIQQPCDGFSNGIAVASVSGGNNPGSFDWYIDNGGLGGPATPVASGDTLNTIMGAYYVEVIDADNCNDTAMIDFSPPANPLTISVSTTAQYRCTGGVQPGTAAATPSGGFSGYTYTWKDSLGSNTISTSNTINQFAGRYNLTITDANQCQATQQVQIPAINGLASIQADTSINPTCSYNNNGSIKIKAQQISGDTLTYLIRRGINGSFFDTIITSDTAIFIGLNADTFYVSIAENCNGDNGLLGGSNGGQFVLTETSNNCCQPTLDSISVAACDTYTSPSSKTWTTSGNFLDTLQSVGGCDSLLVINLKIDTTLNFNFFEDTITACNSNSITIDAGSGFSKYLWNTGDTAQTISASISGNYSITVTGEACTAIDTVTVSIISSFFNSSSATICDRDSFNLKILTSDTSLRFTWFSEADSNIATPFYYLGTKAQCEQYDQQVTAGEGYHANDNWANPNQHAYPISLLFNGVSNPNWKFWRIVKHPNYSTNLPLVSYIQTNWDTTSSIKVSPNKTTTYYCSVSDGINVCTDTFTLIVKSTSETTRSISTFNKHTSFSGKDYYQSTIYSDTLTNVNGCDSVVITNLTVFPPADYTKTVSDSVICFGEQVIITINARDTINNPYINARGCVVCDMLNVNDTFNINGIRYTVADSLMIKDSLNNGGDLTKLCVSKIKNMAFLLNTNNQFNQDISNWDVSNVTNMLQMFADALNFNQNIGNWNVSNVTNMSYMFTAAEDFNGNISNWDVSQVTNMLGMFQGALAFNQNIGGWDVSNVTNMQQMLSYATSFNQDISNWNLRKVTTLHGMFQNSSSFNQNIGKWDVSNVTVMSGLLNNATSFNQDLSKWCVANISSEPLNFSTNSPLNTNNKPNWGSCSPFENYYGCIICTQKSPGDTFFLNGKYYTVVNKQMLLDSINNEADLSKLCVSKVTDMSLLFRSKSNFNQSISNWDVSNVTNMNRMFQFASSFNQDISNWDVGNVQNMSALFHGATSFNQDINTWDVSNVTNMEWIFRSASSFNKKLTNWDVSKVVNMERMFQDASNFNSDISSWQVVNVTNMKMMFYSAYSFNKPIGNWNVNSVTTMESMFSNDCCSNPPMSFNQDLGGWNVSNVLNMQKMFHHAINFNKDISTWNVSSVTNMSEMFHNAKLFNQDLKSWDVSNVTNMSMMFRLCNSFNQNLSNWCVTNITSEPSGFSTNSALAPNNKPVWGTCPP